VARIPDRRLVRAACLGCPASTAESMAIIIMVNRTVDARPMVGHSSGMPRPLGWPRRNTPCGNACDAKKLPTWYVPRSGRRCSVGHWLGIEMMLPSPRLRRTVRTRHRVYGSRIDVPQEVHSGCEFGYGTGVRRSANFRVRPYRLVSYSGFHSDVWHMCTGSACPPGKIGTAPLHLVANRSRHHMVDVELLPILEHRVTGGT
jgi:hypothetical protein